MASEPLLAVLLLGRLGFAPWQYGLAFAAPCVGGLVGSRLARRLAARFGQHKVMLTTSATAWRAESQARRGRRSVMLRQPRSLRGSQVVGGRNGMTLSAAGVRCGGVPFPYGRELAGTRISNVALLPCGERHHSAVWTYEPQRDVAPRLGVRLICQRPAGRCGLSRSVIGIRRG